MGSLKMTRLTTPPARLTPAFVVLGIYGVAFGLIIASVGLFVGPHLLIGGVLHVVLGVFSFAVASGARRGRSWAWSCGLALAAAVVLCCTIAVVKILASPDAVGGLAVFVVFGVLYSAVCVMMLRPVVRRWFQGSQPPTANGR